MNKEKVNWVLPQEMFTGIGSHFDFSLRPLGSAIMAQYALRNQVPVFEMEESGTIAIKADDPKQYLTMITDVGGKLVHQWIDDNYYSYLYLMEDGMAQVTLNGSYLSVSAISTNEEFVRKLTSVNKDFLPKVRKGHIFAIVKQGPQLSLSSIGNAGIPLVAGNYTPQVMEDYRAALKDLNATDPSGRIVIMEGDPGTGKTHLIRAMLLEVPDAMFVLVSPEVVPTLAGPELLPLLLTTKRNNGLDGPIVIVLEDADRCLVTRGENNLNNIQSLLNLGDGILGSLLDLRIVATTNAKKLEMEAALLRPGRLSKRLEVGPLDWDTARSVFRRLVPKAKLPEKLQNKAPTGKFTMTLAEVYAEARKAGWESEKRSASNDDDEDDDYS